MTQKSINSKPYHRISIGYFRIRKLLYVIMLMGCLITSCDDFVEVDLPNSQLPSETVFKDVATATAALKGIYVDIRNILEFSFHGQLGLYADELESFQDGGSPFYDHTVLDTNGTISNWWSNMYNVIYKANAVIEGVENSTALSLGSKDQLKGEAYFIRAYLHFLLVELFGPIPYIKTTDYVINTTVSRIPVEGEDGVYNLIIEDLKDASKLLGEDISEGTEKRIRPYDAVADALLARIYLYRKQWELAENTASKIIDKFVLEPDVNKVFLKDASGTIWQLKPGIEGQNTSIALNFILIGKPDKFALSSNLGPNAFEPNDQRALNWIGSFTDGTSIWYYAFKYKEFTSTIPNSLEYLVMFRLAEQYLIRAEARARLGKTEEAKSDLNVIRTRAGLSNITASTMETMLDAILEERKSELFTEFGHRWFDLKRIQRAKEVLAPIKPEWRDTDLLFPIPENETLLNPNLLPQNEGY